MHHVKTQAAILADWVTLHPLFTIAGAVIVALLIRYALRRRPRSR